MNILAIIPSYRPEEHSGNVGGGEISNRILLEGLAGRGHDVTVLTWNSGGSGSGERNGVTVQDFGLGYRAKYLRFVALARFRGLTKAYLRGKKKPDVIVCGTSGLGVALDLTRSIPAPVGLFVRAFENFDLPKGLVESVIHRIKVATLGDYGPDSVARATFLLPNSKFMEECCLDRCDKKISSTVIYPPLEWQSDPLFKVTSIRRIGMVGTSEKKGIKLVKYLAKRFPDVEFRILGTSKSAEDNGISLKNLKFLGWSDVYDEFSQKVDAVLVPSLCEEAFGRVAVEALACGKPLLVSDIGGLPEAVAYERLLCQPPGDEIVWAEAINRLINDPEPFVMAAKRAASFLHCFSAESQIEKLEQVLKLQAGKYRNLT